MANVEAWTKQFMPQIMAIRRAIDDRKINSSYLDCFPEAVVSAGALLVTTLQKRKTRRSASHRCGLYDFLEQFLILTLEEEEIDLRLSFEAPQALHFVTRPLLRLACSW